MHSEDLSTMGHRALARSHASCFVERESAATEPSITPAMFICNHCSLEEEAGGGSAPLNWGLTKLRLSPTRKPFQTLVSFFRREPKHLIRLSSQKNCDFLTLTIRRRPAPSLDRLVYDRTSFLTLLCPVSRSNQQPWLHLPSQRP